MFDNLVSLPFTIDNQNPVMRILIFTLRKQAYSNILKILPPKNENFQMKNSDILHISALNIDCPERSPDC